MTSTLSPIQRRILETTLLCVSTGGFRVSTDLIGTLAEVSAGTLFRHYASKEILLRAAFVYAQDLLFHNDSDPAGSTLYDQLHTLWYHAADQALSHPDAFTYWRLFHYSPDDKTWSPGHELRPPAFSIVMVLVHHAQGMPIRDEHQTSNLLAWQWMVQWTGALQFALSRMVAKPVNGWPTQVYPTVEQVLAQTFEAAWQSLGLPRQTPAQRNQY